MRSPDGITDYHERSRGRPNAVPLLLLASLMAAGLIGLFGGQPDTWRTVRDERAEMSVRIPATLRNGMVFETRVKVTAKQPVGDLVIGVSDSLWRDFTVNTMIPAAKSETYEGGFHRFSFGKASAGQVLLFKVDAQINPALFAGNSGQVAVFDGERRIAGMPVKIKVLP